MTAVPDEVAIQVQYTCSSLKIYPLSPKRSTIPKREKPTLGIYSHGQNIPFASMWISTTPCARSAIVCRQR